MSDSNAPPASAKAEPPDWPVILEIIEGLAASGEPFFTLTGKPNRIVDYELGRRVLVETEKATNWVQLAWIEENWATFQKKRRVRREDVADPGRRDAFMMALFRLVPGVREDGKRPVYLVLP